MSVSMVALSSGRMLNKHQVEVDRQSPYRTNFFAMCIVCMSNIVIGLRTYAGMVTHPFISDRPATHALVFILHGMTVPWKQVVAYFLTPDAVPGNLLWQVLNRRTLRFHIISVWHGNALRSFTEFTNIVFCS